MATESGAQIIPSQSKDGGKSDKKKRLSIERIYQKKTQLEHILLRPDTYIGSVESVTQNMWVLNEAEMKMVSKEVTFVPGLFKIFDEILVNAADNKQRDPSMTCIKIDVKPADNMIRIWNNGRGIPVTVHKGENMYVPTMIFGHLLTSSNFDDDQKKVTGGRNGYGAKLCNVFSTKFIVETCSTEYGKKFKQSWSNNMGSNVEASISDVTGNAEDFTSITFYPDLKKFKMDSLNDDIVSVFVRRAYDIAASSGCKVFLNGKRLPVTNFKQYIELFTKDHIDDNGQPLKVVYDKVNPRWEVAVAISDKGFQQVSFVNSIATTKGGRHVDYIVDQLTSKLAEIVKKKNSKSSVAVKPFQIKNHLWVFVSCLIENPSFDSQTKENMTLQARSFGSKCELTDSFLKNVQKCGIVESIMTWVKFKEQAQLNQMCTGRKKNTIKGIPKLDDANDAGTRNSDKCTLILTEGDSAKTLAVAGLSVIGRDHYGVFPLRGKVLNVREASAKQIVDNAEINSLIRILGLQYKQPYSSPDSIKSLRYGRIMIMTDQDQDGSHIKGLIVNFIHHNWPNLIKHGFIEQFITPIIKVTKSRNEEKSFYSIPEFEEWKRATPNWHTWRVKYYKGLGTSTSNEAKEYFSDMARHRIRFGYNGPQDDEALLLAFSKKKIEDRKEWLTHWMEDRKRRVEEGEPELYLYTKETKRVSFNDFVNRELILFSNMDNERSIPSLMDGLKPGQRKVLFACVKLNQVKEVKVAQLAGTVAYHSAYHHGEQSLMSTIVNLAQNFVGSNNVNLLKPIGQFGTRLHGGKDSASARYIFTALSTLTRLLYHKDDDPILRYLYDDNQRIEPDYYVPIIPMVLINGASGIGTGWSTHLPNFNPREIVANVRRMLEGEAPIPMLPWYKGFRGEIKQLSEQRFFTFGEVAMLDDNSIEITELPIGIWTQDYKEKVLEVMLNGAGDKVPAVIEGYREYHTDVSVRFVVKMSNAKFREVENSPGGFFRFFKLAKAMSTSSMVLFDQNECLRRYANVEEIITEFFGYRLNLYHRRKEYLVGALQAECKRLENQARFIQELIDSKIDIRKMKRKELIALLLRHKYDSDPMKTWKEEQAKKEKRDAHEEDSNGSESASGGGDAESDEVLGIGQAGQSGHAVPPGSPDYNYLLTMHLWSLTYEDIAALMALRDKKLAHLERLRETTPDAMWLADLDKFIVELDVVEKAERAEAERALLKAASKLAKGGRAVKSKLPGEDQSKPSPFGRRVAPTTDWLKVGTDAPKKGKGKANNNQRDLLEMWGEGENSNAGLELPPVRSLAERLGRSIDSESEMGDKKKKPTKKTVTGPKKPRTAAASASSAAAASAPKKIPAQKEPKRKRKHGSESDDSDLSIVSLSDSEFGVKAEREIRQRKTVNYAFDSGSDDGGSGNAKTPDSDDDFDLSEEEFKPISKPSKPKSQPKAAKKPFSDDDDDDFGISDHEEPKKAPAPAKAAPKPAKPKAKPKATKKPVSDDDSEAEFTSKKKAAKKKIVNKDDSDSLSDFSSKKKKKAAPKKVAAKAPAAAKRKVVVDSDESEEDYRPPSDLSAEVAANRPKRTASKVAASKYVMCSDSEEDVKDDLSDIDYD